MQPVVIEKPYKFIAPWRSTAVAAAATRLGVIDRYLRHAEGVVESDIRGLDHLAESIRRKDGVLLAPNHCRYADPLVMVYLAKQLGCYPYAMASWHLFHESWTQTLAMKALGGFSIYREGADRQSLDTAIEILANESRPLVLFPEGTVFRTNDRLQPLLEGVSLIARSAAKRREKAGTGRVVVHPVAIKYVPLESAGPMAEPMVEKIERRLHWDNAASGPKGLVDRLNRIMHGLLCLKEIEYFGTPQTGDWPTRQVRLVDAILDPLESIYGIRRSDGPIIPRIKALRTAIMPKLLSAAGCERERIWGHLSRIYLAQQVASYPHDYLDSPTTHSRVLETAERLYEDLFDRSHPTGPLKVIMQVDEAIPVAATRDRSAPDVMQVLAAKLQTMLDTLATESPRWPLGAVSRAT